MQLIKNGKDSDYMQTYKIVRYRQNGKNTVIKHGLSLEEAKEHCQDEETRGEGYFDGYTEE